MKNVISSNLLTTAEEWPYCALNNALLASMNIEYIQTFLDLFSKVRVNIWLLIVYFHLEKYIVLHVYDLFVEIPVRKFYAILTKYNEFCAVSRFYFKIFGLALFLGSHKLREY